MWKYVTGCVKETLQRGVNYFDVRCGAGLACNQPTSVVPRKDNAVENYQENYRCSDNSDHTNTRKNDYNWCHDRLANPWLNAFSWSGAIVLGWYTSQLLGLSQKRRRWFEKELKGRQCFLRSNTKALRSALLSCVFAQPPSSITQQVVNTGFFNESSSTSVPYNIANEKDLTNEDRKQDHEVGLDDAIKDLTGVLSSVENQLGLVAIEGGDLREGLAMLHSAAQRNHAPALYNLAICYEKGLGMKKNEKMAAELYRAAASLDHPTALYNLAVFQGQGRGGLARDPMAAEELLRQAAAKGQEDAIRLLRSRQPKVEPTRPVLKEEAFSPPNKTPTEAFLDFIAGNELPTRHQQSVLIY